MSTNKLKESADNLVLHSEILKAINREIANKIKRENNESLVYLNLALEDLVRYIPEEKEIKRLAEESPSISVPYFKAVIAQIKGSLEAFEDTKIILKNITKEVVDAVNYFQITLLELERSIVELEKSFFSLTKQYAFKLDIESGRKLGLKIIYYAQAEGEIIEERNPLVDVAKEAVELGKTLSTLLIELNQKLIKTTEIMLKNESTRKFLKYFVDKDLTYYVVSTNIGNAFFGKITKIFSKKKDLEISYIPNNKEIAIFISTHLLMYETENKIASSIFHEITHASDKYFAESENSEEELKLIYSMKAEGIACFGEVLFNPERISHYLTKEFMKQIPLNDIGNISQKLEGYTDLTYAIGTYMMIQLFLKYINKKEDIKDIELIKNDLITYQKKASTLLNLIKLMNLKKFFEYYYEKISEPILTKKFIYKITSSVPQ